MAVDILNRLRQEPIRPMGLGNAVQAVVAQYQMKHPAPSACSLCRGVPGREGRCSSRIGAAADHGGFLAASVELLRVCRDPFKVIRKLGLTVLAVAALGTAAIGTSFFGVCREEC